MAEELLGSGRVEIRGDASGFTQAANQANSAFAQLEQIVATNWWGIQNLGMAFAALPSAIAAGTGVAISYAREWEDAMFHVARTSGATLTALDEIEDSLFRVARITPLATTELAALASEGAALGIPNENLAEFARVMGMTVASTDLTADGIENVARVLNIMQVPVEEYENFASALIDVGRSTAATESDIITAAKRLATVGSIAGATTPQIIGMGAALRSLGPEAEAGATAINKTITDMAKAVNQEGDELVSFARIAGVSIDQFSEMVKTNAYDALILYITGLGRMPDALVGVQQAFDDTSAAGVRQQQALATLANGTRDVGSQQRDLNAIMEQSARIYAERSTLAEIEEARMNTMTGQMQILKNAVFEVGTAFGSLLLPQLKNLVSLLSIVAEFMNDVVSGFQLIPGPIQIVISTFALLTFGIMALAAAILLIGPRMVIAVGAMRQLRGVQQQATQGTGRLTDSTLTLAQAQRIATRTAQEHRAGLAGVLGLIGGLAVAQQKEAAATARTTAVGEQKIGMLNRMRAAYANLSVWQRRAIASTLAMTGVMIASTIWMAKLGDAAQQAANNHANMLAELRAELRERALVAAEQGASAEAIQREAIAHAKQQKIYKDSASAARALGMDMETLNSILTGRASAGQSQMVINSLRDQAKDGSKEARVLLTNMKDLYGSFGPVRDATKDNTLATLDYAGANDKAAGSAKKLADTLEQQARAHIDYIGALFSAREAELSLKDAEDELRKARDAAANPLRAIQKAERELSAARRAHRNALRDLTEAERDLGRARQDGIDELAGAMDSLADSRDAYLDNLDKIMDLEEDIDKLRRGPTMKELTKATNDLRNAQLRLLGAHRKVSDAEWYLQYIRQQGGSTRDIEDAEFALAEARQGVADSQESLVDAEDKLADLRDTAARQRELIKMERDLAAARRRSGTILRDIRQGEQEVYDLRQRVARDDFYRQAQERLGEAQHRVADSADRAREAELNLSLARSGGGQAARDLERAQLSYETALYRVATANTEVHKQTALMRGETWNAGREAAVLAQELGRLSGSIPDADARRRMSEFMNILANAPAVPDVGDWEDGINDALGDMDLSDGLGAAIDDVDFGEAFGDNLGNPQWWQGLGPLIGMALAPVIMSGLKAAVGALAAATGMSVVMSALAIAIVLGLAAYLIKDRNWAKVANAIWQGMQIAWGAITNIGQWLWQNIFYPALSALFPMFTGTGLQSMKEFAGGIFSGIGDAIGALDRLGDNMRRHFLNAGSWLIDAGRRLIGGLVSGIGAAGSAVWNALGVVNRTILNFFSNAFSWLTNAGRNIVVGLANGIGSNAGSVLNWFRNLPSRIWDILKGIWNTGGTLFNAGVNMVWGLIKGIGSMGKQLWDSVSGFVSRNIPGPVKWALGISSPSKVMAELGRYATEGLGVGLLADEDMISKAAHRLAEAAQPDIGKMAASYDLDYMTSGDAGMGKFDSRVASARVPVGVGGTTVNYGDTVNIDVESNAEPEDIVNAYFWKKRVRVRG